MNGVQLLGLLLVFFGSFFFIIPGIFGVGILSLFGLGAFITGLLVFGGFILLPGVLIVGFGYWLYTRGGRWA